MAAIKIKSTHPESQGDFVLIEEEDFDAEKGHELLDAPKTNAPKLGLPELREALTARNIAIPEGAKKADLQALLDAA